MRIYISICIICGEDSAMIFSPLFMNELYAKFSTDDTGDQWLSVYRGINTIRNYPTTKFIGNINITQRKFIKRSKHPRKIIQQDAHLITLTGYDFILTKMNVLFENLGYTDAFLTEISHVIQTYADNPSFKVCVHSRADDEGIFDF